MHLIQPNLPILGAFFINNIKKNSEKNRKFLSWGSLSDWSHNAWLIYRVHESSLHKQTNYLQNWRVKTWTSMSSANEVGMHYSYLTERTEVKVLNSTILQNSLSCSWCFKYWTFGPILMKLSRKVKYLQKQKFLIGFRNWKSKVI